MYEVIEVASATCGLVLGDSAKNKTIRFDNFDYISFDETVHC